MKKSDAFLYQAKADLDFAKKVSPTKGFNSCYFAAHCQQGTEKAIKAIAFALNLKNTSKLEHSVSGLLVIIVHSSSRNTKQFDKFFKSPIRQFIKKMDELFPSANEDKINTEYPFKKNGDWIAPCDHKFVKNGEVDQWEQSLERIICRANWFLLLGRFLKSYRSS